MRLVRNFASFAVILGVLTVVSATAQKYNNPLSGRALEQKIFKELRGLPYYGVFDHITYQVNGNSVVLGGSVYSNGTKKSAERAVEKIAGVSQVVNNIEQIGGSPLDDSIRVRAFRTFANGGLGRYFPEIDPSVRIIVDRGRLTLEGYVSSRGDYNLFNILANGVSGTFRVTNNLKVGRDDRR